MLWIYPGGSILESDPDVTDIVRFVHFRDVTNIVYFSYIRDAKIIHPDQDLTHLLYFDLQGLTIHDAADYTVSVEGVEATTRLDVKGECREGGGKGEEWGMGDGKSDIKICGIVVPSDDNCVIR